MQPTTLIETQALLTDRNFSSFVVLDCRFDLAAPEKGRAEYLRAHIPGAQYADLERDLSAPVTAVSGRHPLPDPADFARRAAAWGIGNDTPTIVYDQSNGSMAARAWWMLRSIGAQRVLLLNGGMDAWLRTGGGIESGARPAPAPRRFQLAARSWGIVTTAEVAAALADPATTLVDARARARYLGETEPIDPVAGHIPGAESFPFTQNLDERGLFLPPGTLRERWSALLAGRPPGAVISMCGSGVTACHNLLALEIAGLGGARLYAGSWSEWIRDPARPMARNSHLLGE